MFARLSRPWRIGIFFDVDTPISFSRFRQSLVFVNQSTIKDRLEHARINLERTLRVFQTTSPILQTFSTFGIRPSRLALVQFQPAFFQECCAKISVDLSVFCIEVRGTLEILNRLVLFSL